MLPARTAYKYPLKSRAEAFRQSEPPHRLRSGSRMPHSMHAASAPPSGVAGRNYTGHPCPVRLYRPPHTARRRRREARQGEYCTLEAYRPMEGKLDCPVVDDSGNRGQLQAHFLPESGCSPHPANYINVSEGRQNRRSAAISTVHATTAVGGRGFAWPKAKASGQARATSPRPALSDQFPGKPADALERQESQFLRESSR